MREMMSEISLKFNIKIYDKNVTLFTPSVSARHLLHICVLTSVIITDERLTWL